MIRAVDVKLGYGMALPIVLEGFVLGIVSNWGEALAAIPILCAGGIDIRSLDEVAGSFRYVWVLREPVKVIQRGNLVWVGLRPASFGWGSGLRHGPGYNGKP